MSPCRYTGSVLREFGIPLHVFRHLIDSHQLSLVKDETGRYVWDAEAIESLRCILTERRTHRQARQEAAR